MSLFEKQVAIGSGAGTDQIWTLDGAACDETLRAESEGAAKPREFRHLCTTFLTTLSCFGVFFVQGMIIARILGPMGRGEFGSAIYFPRDILLYAGLLGGFEIVNSYAKKKTSDAVALKYSAARLGIFSGAVTAIVAAILAIVVFTLVPGKTYLIPVCLLCCVFLPFEHIQLNVSAVDRGKESYSRYNFNRFIFALAFPVLVIIAFGFNELFQTTEQDSLYKGFDGRLGISALSLMCVIFVLSRVIGLLPTLRGMNLITTFKSWLAGRIQEKSRTDELDVPNVGRLLTEGRPYALSMFATELFERLDIFLILALGTIQESGYYFVAVPAAALLTVAPNALGVFTFNAGADPTRKVTLKEGVSVMLGLTTIQILGTAVFMFIIPYLIVLFYTDAYLEAIPFALWLLPACAMKGYLQAVDGYLKGRGKPLIGVWARVLSIFVMCAFVWLVFPKYQLISIPMAACVGQALSMLIITVAVVRDIIEPRGGNIAFTAGGST